MRRITAIAAFLLWPQVILAETASPPPQEQQLDRPAMRFEWVREGPPERCRDKCREWISATGRIVPTTPTDFESFAAARSVRGATIVLDSGGGAVVPGLALGRAFRKAGVSTVVGRTIREGGNVSLSSRASCNSMCVFLLLGGVKRHVPEEARVLVHQIWPASKREDATATTYTATQMLLTQRTLGQVARYTVDMGGDVELFEIATRTPPWENLRPLTRDELRRLGVHNADTVFDAQARAGGPPPPPTAPIVAPRAAPTDQPVALGWSVVNRSGQSALARQHVLTIEGLQIGAFEISFECGERPGVYQVRYVEHRSASSEPEADRLDAVGIAVQRERALLKVESSRLDEGGKRLVSVARGTVAQAMLDGFLAPEQTTLAVATSTAKKARTTTRIGRTGFAEGLAKLSCSR